MILLFKNSCKFRCIECVYIYIYMAVSHLFPYEKIGFGALFADFPMKKQGSGQSSCFSLWKHTVWGNYCYLIASRIPPGCVLTWGILFFSLWLESPGYSIQGVIFPGFQFQAKSLCSRPSSLGPKNEQKKSTKFRQSRAANDRTAIIH